MKIVLANQNAQHVPTSLADNEPLGLVFNVNNAKYIGRGESEIEILNYALDSYRNTLLDTMAHNVDDETGPGSEYNHCLQTIIRINEMLTDVTTALCGADHTKRFDTSAP